VKKSYLSAIECSVHGFNDVRQTEIRTEQPLAQSSGFEVQNATGKLKGHKLPSTAQILKEFLRAGVDQFAMRSKTY
jgi:hypothetical protein